MIPGEFEQTKEWAGFQESLGKKIFWIENAMITKVPLKWGLSYLYCPKGPIEKITEKFLNELKKLAKQERAIFFKCEPAVLPPKNLIKARSIQPEITQILNIEKNEEELLAAMHQKTRYNVHLAERKKVQIKMFADEAAIEKLDEFYSLLQGTEQRKGIRLWPKNYYKKLLGLYFNKLFIAYSDEQPLAGAMVNLYKDTATYLHGGTAKENLNLMAPYLLHWKIIKYAKGQGMKFYDWWGINPEPGHKWAGITRFKKGFGGEELHSPGAFDLPINKFLYKLYGFFRK